ncbi:phospholipase D family protein [Photobacterium rosenbergii]|uniref:Phospholipase D family protein n=1 Tax=Photobacterium rosenbergii TaxID=294936 RepID=A0ABU3ZEQ7_9GAMM|nr:phospholipase D family protein [Photobacterium rosenbergii]MDV5168561.1 phospholipase D family protein [Photobacterium rosenbergii]
MALISRYRDFTANWQPDLSRRVLLVFITGLIAGCTSKPEQWLDKTSLILPDTYLGQVYLIPDAPSALAHRIEAVRESQAYIEAEYFSWAGDVSGMTLWQELRAAADRGVKVRIIVDDLLFFDDKWLVDIDTHPNLSIKIFNPFNARKLGWLTRAADFEMHRDKLNHRLHEKYFNVDGEVMILGGRNIGDDYFGYSPKANFFDLDVMVKGEVITEYEHNFDNLWASQLTVPVSEVIGFNPKKHSGSFDKAHDKVMSENRPLQESISRKVSALPTPEYIGASLTPIFDSAHKGTDSQSYLRKRIEHLANVNQWPVEELFLSTPYMIESDEHQALFSGLAEREVEVTVLTNSVASNDSPFASAYYQAYRPALMAKGIHIYEYDSHALHYSNFYNANAYYHNKAFIADNTMSFIGSSNFDPRSDMTNLELGLLIESQVFATELKTYLLGSHKDKFWLVSQGEGENYVWSKQGERTGKEPRMKSDNRFINSFYRMLKIQNEL